MKRNDEETQNLILISLDEEDKLTIITVSGKIDFNSFSKLSGSIKSEQLVPEMVNHLY